MDELFDGEAYDLRRKFYDDCLTNLLGEYELVYVDYRDQLTDEQVAWLAAKDWESLDASMDEWLDDVRYESADYHRTEVMDETEAEWAEAHGHEIAEAVRSAFRDTDLHDELRYAIEDRDRSNPLRDLAGNTPRVLMRQVLGEARLTSEDDIEDLILADLGVPDIEHNREAIRNTLPECGEWVQAMIVCAVDPSDLYNTMTAKEVEVIDPYLYLGNPYMGDGYCEEQLHAAIRLDRDSLTTDKSAFGYGWEEIAGVYVSAYECNLIRVDWNKAEGATA
jgi:hypothetical protein